VQVHNLDVISCFFRDTEPDEQEYASSLKQLREKVVDPEQQYHSAGKCDTSKKFFNNNNE